MKEKSADKSWKVKFYFSMTNYFRYLFLIITTLGPIFSLSVQAQYDMKFMYVPHEGSGLPNNGVLDCTHERIRDLPDWTVKCGKNEKTYTAHVIVRQATRDFEPQSMIEILYWITEPGETPTSIRKYHSNSSSIYLKDKTSVFSMILYQGVENDQSSLRLEIFQK